MRVLRTLSFCLALVGASRAARAHVVTVDGSEADWSTRVPANSNVGIVARAAGNTGEYIFLDASGDRRTDAPSTANQDILRFQTTADATNLYFLIRAVGA